MLVFMTETSPGAIADEFGWRTWWTSTLESIWTARRGMLDSAQGDKDRVPFHRVAFHPIRGLIVIYIDPLIHSTYGTFGQMITLLL